MANSANIVNKQYVALINETKQRKETMDDEPNGIHRYISILFTMKIMAVLVATVRVVARGTLYTE